MIGGRQQQGCVGGLFVVISELLHDSVNGNWKLFLFSYNPFPIKGYCVMNFLP